MTVTYTGQVATCRGLGCFWKLLFRWRGSIYKLLWPNLIVYYFVYFSLSILYRFGLNAEHRIVFEKICLHCQMYVDLIPIAFVLGFYVSIVIKRWWDQYICMPWPDNLAMFVSTLIQGQEDRGRLMRRTIMRYVNLCLVITLRMMSPRVKKRFPTMDHLVEAGFLQPNEKKIFDDLDQKTSHPKYWMPLVWAGGIITRARKENRITNDFALKTLIDELNIFRSGCGGMLNYDWISIPLVYTQVVTLAVYAYFMATLMGNQFLDPAKKYPKHELDLVFPVFTFLQFFFYMGWLKVAESLVNPFGEDDDDFELNWLVDRNLQVSYVIVDEMHQEHPEMVKDQYWDEVFPAELPYTVASKSYQTGPPAGSAENVEVSNEQAEFMPMESILEEDPEKFDILNDLEGDEETGNGERKETHPMKIVSRQKSDSTNSLNAGSFSGARGTRKSSVLNMLTKIFRREGSKTDLAGSMMGSNLSLPSRRAVRSNSRISTAQSRTSIPRINTFQDEVFHMSDVSLAGSVVTSESPPIQIVMHKNHEVNRKSIPGENDIDNEELARLLGTSRKISKDMSIEGDSKLTDVLIENMSDGSGNSVKIPFPQESWSATVDPETCLKLSPQQRPDFAKQLSGPPVVKLECKENGATSPLITFTDPNGTTEPLGSGSLKQIVPILPSSAPIKHMFVPVSFQSGIVPVLNQQPSTAKDYPPIPKRSSLSRSLQQRYSVGGDPPLIQVPYIKGDMFDNDLCASTPLLSDTTRVVTVLSPAVHPELSTSKSPPPVSLPSVLIPTTSIVTVTPSSSSSITVSSAINIPISSSLLVDQEKPPDIPWRGSGGSFTRPLSPNTPPPTTFIIEIEQNSEMGEILEETHSPPGPPYVPSAAIPVPSVSPAHVSGSTEEIEAAVVPLSRRAHHDFHELETISEHGEHGDSPLVPSSHKDDPPPRSPPKSEVKPLQESSI